LKKNKRDESKLLMLLCAEYQPPKPKIKKYEEKIEDVAKIKENCECETLRLVNESLCKEISLA